MFDLRDSLSTRARDILYAVFAILGIVIGAVQVGVAAAEMSQPVWLTVALAVYAFLGGAFGKLSRDNINPE